MKFLARFLSIAIPAAFLVPGISLAFDTLDSRSFFETGRLRSEDRILFQKPRSPDIPASERSKSWQFVIFRSEGFSTWMPPGVITNENVTLDTSLGKVPFRAIASNSENRRYVVAYADTLTEEQLKNPKELLSAIRERVAPKDRYKLTGDRSISIDKHPGRELTFSSADTNLTIRAYLVNNKAYVIGVSDPKNRPDTRSTRAFLNAFQLVQ
ncbi:hypothetical protein V0288_10880 [Pannus brasiliensis CCIBt3594]|uniref:Uncharacterized protein n=1 Tax=Pannus brasiliensis CCIBt3594 TaxID=1427578 RepID=A0AAW9QKK8_9CHRO